MTEAERELHKTLSCMYRNVCVQMEDYDKKLKDQDEKMMLLQTEIRVLKKLLHDLSDVYRSLQTLLNKLKGNA